MKEGKKDVDTCDDNSDSINPLQCYKESLIQKVRTGPPTKYDVSMCKTIIEAAAEGAHIPGMMLAIGIGSKETWYEWKNRYPEFKAAVEYSEVVSQALHEQIGYLGTTGQIKGFQPTSYAMTMNNKFPKDYSRSGTGGDHTEITINQVNLSSDEMMEKIGQKLEKLKSLGVDPFGNNNTQQLIEHDTES